jgi:DNA-directed RNA polymerase II subunit RPB2
MSTLSSSSPCEIINKDVFKNGDDIFEEEEDKSERDIEMPWTIIESYFQGKHLERLVRHQLESYNNFISNQIDRTIDMFNPVHIASEQDYDPKSKYYALEIFITFENFKIHRPQIQENNGSTKIMFPQEARLRNFTYASAMMIDINIKFVVRTGENMENIQTLYKTLSKIHIGKLPIMLKSDICVLSQYKHVNNDATGECKYDAGGYFIINGSEKTVLGQERAAENKLYCFNISKNSTKYTWQAEIKSIPDFKCISPKQITMMISSKNNGFGFPIVIQIPKVKQPVPLFVLFRALGIISDKEICEKIILDIDDTKYTQLFHQLQASIIDSNTQTTKEDCIKHIMGHVMYTPINMDVESGNKKKYNFTLDILNNDLFPHCKTPEQKVYFLGYMCNRLLQTSLDWLKQDDRDSYVNKRVDLSGPLLNNLFRNYFNKLVKDMEKQIIKEINIGSWRSTDDYLNIINLTNIYKIIKSTTIENGIKRALSTGDFGIKHINNNKVGVAQVLNRLTYVASLSHSRRISTPTDKSGKLIPPRKLHNTSWGLCCNVETPEGASVGIVKNLSIMAHVTINSSSIPIYEMVLPNIIQLFEIENVKNLFNQTKVFINGCWVGITKDNSKDFYQWLKEKKYKGIINIYTSIVFDYKINEIRICNDAGRLCRPLLRVNDSKTFITKQLIQDINDKKINWDNLLTNCTIDNSIIEYIDAEEQSWSMIAMDTTVLYKNRLVISGLTRDDNNKLPEFKINYTHCEIHPSTILGVLASCIPFPECNQSPRNTYQAAQAKQAMGMYVTNFDNRMDKTAYVLTTPARPLVDTRFMDMIQINKIPSGFNIIVAIMSHTGYNQEDSVLMNKASLDRGLFQVTVYHTEKDEDKQKINGDEEIRCKPDITKTKGMKFANYNKVNGHGLIPENTLVENRDVIISKVIPIKENKNNETKIIKYEDQSRIFKTDEPTYIDKNYIDRNGDGYNFAKVRLRTQRKPVIGDKFCALPTQQILTDNGWIPICDIDIIKHRVCTLDTNGNMIYELPVAKFVYDHDDEMYSIKNNHIEIVCTLNHKLYVKRNSLHSINYELIEAQNVIGKKVRFQKTMNNTYPDINSIDINSCIYKMNVWLEFLGLFINNGLIVKDNIVLKCFNSKILSDVNIIYSYNDNNSNYYISKSENPKIFEHLNNLYKTSLTSNKYLPLYTWKLSQTQCIIFLNAILQDEHNQYNTTSITLANDISRLALHCGYSAHIKKVNRNNTSFESLKTYYTIHINRINNQPLINKINDETNKEELVYYEGKVYCIEMPSSHLYYSRESTFSSPVILGNSQRGGQKGTLGNIIPEEDMPFTRSGIKPDLILNPHAMPSRMTMAYLKETLLGKVLVQLGLYGDGTSFGDLDINIIRERLLSLGFESNGEEVMYNGTTGEQMECNIFMGPVFYQRLKHMVADKQHSRSFGPMVNLTRQPAEGRCRDGGLRFGEMERDAMISHGACRFTKGRMYDASDKYQVYICKKCGLIVSYNDKILNDEDTYIHLCKACNNRTEFSYVEIPYSAKLLFQELITMNIVPRIMTNN